MKWSLLLLFLPLVLHAQDFVYTSDGGEITIVRYNGPDVLVQIPDTIDGLPVTTIGDDVFNGRRALDSIRIPDSVTSIGDRAFSLCRSLRNVDFPDGLISIGVEAFKDCSAVAVLNIPDGVISIGRGAFSGCSSVASITIPSSVTSIGDRAFSSCTSLTSITIPGGVTSIGEFAFFGCSGLRSVTISNSVTSIGEGAFSSCPGVTNIAVDSTNLHFSSLGGVLFNKDQTTLVQCPAGISVYSIPDSVTSIGDSAFGGAEGLTSITIPNGVISIAARAFSRCTGLTSVRIPKSVTSIGDAAFVLCTSLTNVTIPDSVTSIGDRAFSSCFDLASVFFQGAPPSLAGSNVFLSANNVIVYYLPQTVGWETTFSGRPTVLWDAQVETTTAFGIAGDRLGFTITGTTGLPVAVEVSDNLNNPGWTVVETYVLGGNPTSFSDPELASLPSRFYRIRPW